ncbi:MAG: 16S rRNA (adenine(1518)-N(6)/adenine(1519)-N(6))-dimethyltransferase RsmA [Mycoplasmataceae bacterium]|jgi:16S rRNA (adenine1518-N6/adenine1519-N6)-dimethyltransferase|nr:16S rRNA (adenine(1518)-N(6)/adenine(1519)-N(6))-dimethyltransferase RsmA [Mycoplasmataceae bacterium]
MEDAINYLKRTQFNPSKKMGQNFLINKEVYTSMVNKIDFSKYDLVLEIGPGLGALTDILIQKTKKIIVIEIDKRLSEYIAERYKQYDAKKFELLNIDALKTNFNELAKEYKNTVIVSNLPYSISSIVVIKFIKSEIKNMYCMLQKEMVERMMAIPRTKQYNAFTVLLNTYCKIKKLVDISRSSFYPVPEVDSTFISISKNNKSYDENYDKFIRMCFNSKRRTLLNNLKNIIDKNTLSLYLKKNKISGNARAEELTYLGFISLYNFYIKNNGKKN